ncbi:MAG: hypothetical protein HKN36_02205 [Hellea sp.]|nr:hypothetical protein [Hellea sp.]
MKTRWRILIILIVILSASLFGYTWETKNLETPWSTAESMQTGRSEIAAARLGDKVLTVGGIGNFRILKSCEIFDISRNNWYTCPDLPRRTHHIAVASDGRHFYAGGGFTSFGFDLGPPDLLRLDIKADKWEAVATLPFKVGEHALHGHEGDLFLIGGQLETGDSNQLWRFKQGGIWERLSDMPTARHSFASMIISDELWVTGGRSNALGTKIDKIEIYNFASNLWRSGPVMPTGRGGHYAAQVGDEIHIIGGEVFGPVRLINDHEVYNLTTEQWSERAQMPVSRHGGSALAINGKVFLFGGGRKPAIQTVISASSKVLVFTPE